MREVQLTRSGEDRRRYEIDGIGWLRNEGLLRLRSEAGTDHGGGWTFQPRGWTGRRFEVLDAVSSQPVAEYRRTGKLTYDGTITWRSRSYDIRRTSAWRQHFSLFLDGEQVLELEVKSFGKRPVVLRIAPILESEPGLVLFACWTCQRFVSQQAGAA